MALQFPDELMVHSVDVVQLLSMKTPAVLAILADTSYGRSDTSIYVVIVVIVTSIVPVSNALGN